MQQIKVDTILINQTDNIGDLVLSLPMTGILKHHFPNCKIIVLARRYTESVVKGCATVDQFLDWEAMQEQDDHTIIQQLNELNPSVIFHISKNKRIAELAYKARIPYRVGTNQRPYHWFYCNRMVNLGRRHSRYHEAQLNLKLLKPLGIENIPPLNELVPFLQLQSPSELPEHLAQLLSKNKFNLIIHPGSLGHGREWPSDNFLELIHRLDTDKIKLFLTGAPKEEEVFRDKLNAKVPQATNLMGQMSLAELISFIQAADGLIASGTGPLHLAAALGIKTLGLFPPRKGISPRRWQPLGKQGEYLMYQRPFGKMCLGCRDSVGCACMQNITVDQVYQVIERWSATENQQAA